MSIFPGFQFSTYAVRKVRWKLRNRTGPDQIWGLIPPKKYSISSTTVDKSVQKKILWTQSTTKFYTGHPTNRVFHEHAAMHVCSRKLTKMSSISWPLVGRQLRSDSLAMVVGPKCTHSAIKRSRVHFSQTGNLVWLNYNSIGRHLLYTSVCTHRY